MNDSQIGWHTEISPDEKDNQVDLQYPSMGFMFEYLDKSSKIGINHDLRLINQYQVLNEGLELVNKAVYEGLTNVNEACHVFLSRLPCVNHHPLPKDQLASHLIKMASQGLISPFTTPDLVSQYPSEAEIHLPIHANMKEGNYEYSIYVGFTWINEDERLLNITLGKENITA